MFLDRFVISKHSKKTLYLFLLFSLIGVAVVAFKYFYREKETDIMLAAKSRTSLFITRYESGVITKIDLTRVNPGDSVRVLGVSKNYLYWAQTSDGQRGWIAPEVFDDRAFLIDKHKLSIQGKEGKEGKSMVSNKDTLRVIERGPGDSYFSADYLTVKDSKGVIYHKVKRDMIPLLAIEKKIQTVKMTVKGVEYYKFFTKKSFERKFIGGDFESLDSKYYRAAFVSHNGDVTTATYPFKVFDKSTGSVYEPTLTITGGKYQSVEYKEFDSNNRMILKWLPFVNSVIGSRIFAPLLDSSIYEEIDPYQNSWTDPSNYGGVMKIIVWILIAVVGLIYLLSFIMMVHLVPFLFFGLLLFEKPLKLLEDKAVITILYILEIISIYFWSLILMADNYFWWFILPVLILSAIWAIKSFKEFFNSFPYNRCFHCKSVFTYQFDHTITVRNYLEWRKSTESGGVIGKNTYKYQTYDLYSDGSHRNVKHHTETKNIYQMNQYNILYDITEYQDIYKCSKCGDEMSSPIYERREEKERKHLDSYAV